MNRFRLLLPMLMLLCPLMLRGAEVILRPYLGNSWTEAYGKIPETVTLPIPSEEIAGTQALLFRVDELMLRLDRRTRAHQEWLILTEEEESPLSDAAVRFELCWKGAVYPFDRWGNLHVDLRFIDDSDKELLTQFKAFYARIFARSSFARERQAAIEEKPEQTADTLPVFYGFEDDRYQQHDALILKLVAEFNANPAAWAGAAEGTTVDVPKLEPALIKSLMIEETGGNGPRSTAAWKKDPLQVNVPGDWSDAKRELGLHKPQNRNEGTLEGNVRAGIMFLVRKGFGVSGSAVASRPEAYFDSWRAALQRYNGRKDKLRDGRSYRAAYASRILRRAASPNTFVPIASDRRRHK